MSQAHIETAEYMLAQMERNRLTVTLAPSMHYDIADRGGKIRVVTERNPAWYRQMCADYPPNRRKPRRGKRGERDTLIKRQHTLAALRRIIKGDLSTEYAQRVYEYVLSEHVRIADEIASGTFYE